VVGEGGASAKVRHRRLGWTEARLPESQKVVTLPLDMASRFEKMALKEALTGEVAICLVYEARQKIESAGRENLYKSVFDAFLNLGRVQDILDVRFEKIRRELYEKAKEKLLSAGASEPDLRDEIVLEEAANGGLTTGLLRPLPKEMGVHSIHYGFVAEIFKSARYVELRYVQGVGWEVLTGEGWQRRPKERGIVGLIYEVMAQKIRIWREALGGYGGEGGWLEKLERNINDPDWLSKVEELLLRVDHFGVEIVSNEA
jgi:hypothetical protein